LRTINYKEVNMIGINMKAEIERQEFAKRAADDFEKYPEHTTFGNIGCGEYLAIRWGLDNDCVLVILQDESREAVNYYQLIRRKL
jgi:HD-like signal output (HDOD) protein